MEKLNITIDNTSKILSISWDEQVEDRYAYKNIDDVSKIIEEYLGKEVVDFCPICGEPIYEEDETMNDNSNSYGGDCHETCYLDAQESRFC